MRKPRKNKNHKEFIQINVLNEDARKDIIFSEPKGKWILKKEAKSSDYPLSSAEETNIKSFRAFRRKLKKLPAGYRFKIISKYKGGDIEGFGSDRLYF